MPFRFKLAEPFEDALRRIGREQIERAQAQFKGAADPISAVHETRKSLKRLRALLHLVRPAIGDETYRAENTRLREVGRMLSSTRDRHVLLETIAKLDNVPTIGRKGPRHAVREALDGANGAESQTVEAATMKQAQGLLGEAGRRFARLRLDGKGFDVVGAGLEASYRKGAARLPRRVRRADRRSLPRVAQGHAAALAPHDAALARLDRVPDARVRPRREACRRFWATITIWRCSSAFVHSQRASGIGEEAAVRHQAACAASVSGSCALWRSRWASAYSRKERAGLHRRIAAYWEAAVALKEHEPEEEAAAAKKLTRAVRGAVARQAPASGP